MDISNKEARDKLSSVTKENILEAVEYINKNGILDKHKSKKYDVIINNKKYPPKYVVAIAYHLATGEDIDTRWFNTDYSKPLLKKLGFVIEAKDKIFTLTIEADKVTSTDELFSMDNLGLGNKYKPVDCYFENNKGEVIRRNRKKGEKKISNQTMPKLACQIFETEIENLSDEEKRNFPICRYRPDLETIIGIFKTEEDFRKQRNSIEYLIYTLKNNTIFVFYCWNIFSTIIFVQECLKRFGENGDKFILKYKLKEEIEPPTPPQIVIDEFKNKYSKDLLSSKNIIFRGAPGTGKSYLAKEIATDIISNGTIKKYEHLSDEQKEQIEFIQFHPSYDYTDFVEGLRPKINKDGSMGFELQDGIFKKFVMKAKNSFEKYKTNKPFIFIIDEINRGDISKIFGELFFAIDPGYRGVSGEVSTQYSNLHNNPNEKLYIPENVYIIGTMNDIDRSVDSFDFAMRRRFRFIEIKANERLEMLDKLDVETKNEAIQRMNKLNSEIVNVEDLNENYQIGASYFLKVKEIGFDKLWTDYLQPLLHEYIRGMYDEKEIMRKFAKAYGYLSGEDNETIED